MKKMASIVLIVFAFLVLCNTAFSDDKRNDEKTQSHLLQEILLLNKQISKISYVNKKSRNILKKTKNKYSYEIYLSFANIYKTFLWCSDLSHWLSQTYNNKNNMNSHIYARIIANKKSIKKTLGYVDKIYKHINNVNLLHIIDTQEKIIGVGLDQLDKIILYLKKIEEQKTRKKLMPKLK